KNARPVNNPLFWLGVSLLLVAISLMALLTVAIFTLQELARAARSAEKLLDMLNREMPATLKDLRLTGKELATLSDEVSGSMQSARSVVQQVDQGLSEAKSHAHKAQITARSLGAGAAAAWRVLAKQPRRRRRPPTRRPPVTPNYENLAARSLPQPPSQATSETSRRSAKPPESSLHTTQPAASTPLDSGTDSPL
ncbi:MAG: hypothetical protein WBC73_13990, partial [Phormidesmis sp.]